jgi:hypothetical protein
VTDGVEVSPPTGARLLLGCLARAGIGGLTILASVGWLMLPLATPLERVLNRGFSLDSWWGAAFAFFVNGVALLLWVVPVVATVLPGTRWFESSGRRRSILIGAWWAWLAVSVVGWIGLYLNVGTWGDDPSPGGGFLILIVGGFALSSALSVAVGALVSSWTQRRRALREHI